MQCPSCRFENMPGLETCGRCGTSLVLATAAIDVHPPRASHAAKRVRQVVPRRLLYRARDAAALAHRAITRSIVEESRIPLPEPGVLPRLFVPGWAHFYTGQRIRGWFFLGAFLPLLLLALTRWGTPLGSIAAGLAFSVHASSVLDILIRQGTVRFPKMMATAFIVSLVLGLLIYAPAGWLLSSRLAAPIEFAYDAPPFQRDDVVLINLWAYALTAPHCGDVVQFRPVSAGRMEDPNRQAFHTRLIYEQNELIDRVVGLPGDRVVWDAGKLTVNGTPVAWTPLVPERLPPHLEIVVPADRYLILPTTSVGAANEGGSESYWKTAGLIPVDDILGVAYLRVAPLSRVWLIR
jgi:signal peptidase I